jgi:hypothetical protein
MRCSTARAIVFVVEVMGHFEAVGPALTAEDLPPRLGAQQEPVAAIDAVAAVEPMLDTCGPSAQVSLLLALIDRESGGRMGLFRVFFSGSRLRLSG